MTPGVPVRAARAPRWGGGRVAGRGPLLVPAALGLLLLLLPLLALLLRVDWPGFLGHLSSPVVGPALRLSALTTTITLVLVLVLGTPLAWLLARAQGRWVPVARAVVTVPLVLPPVVGGVALLMAWGRGGVVGGPLGDLFGVSIPFTTVAVVLAELFVALPFYVVTVEGSMRGLARGYDQVAATLGASPTRTFLRVVVPMVAPGVAAGAALAWARALGEFGATITFAGSFPGRTQTAPLAVYSALEQDPQAAIALSTLLLLVCVVVLTALRARWVR